MSAFDDMTENMKAKVLKDTIQKLEGEKEQLERANFELEAKLTQLSKMNIDQVGRYLAKDMEVDILKKQVTRKTNLHNKTAKRLKESRRRLYAAKKLEDSQRGLIDVQDSVIDDLKRNLEIARRTIVDLEKDVDTQKSNVAGWKNQFEILEDKVKQTEETKQENWELAVKYWRNKYEDAMQGWTNSLKRNTKTDERLRVIRKQRKAQYDQKAFFTKLNRAAGNEIKRLVSQIRKLENENEDGKHFKRLEKAYDELHDRHKDALAQIEHQTRLADYSDSYIHDLENTRSKLAYEIEQLKEDTLHLARISRKG